MTKRGSDWNRGFDHHRSYKPSRRSRRLQRNYRRPSRERSGNGRRWLGILGVFVILAGLAYWQLPAILRLVPSRYLAAYVPDQVTEQQYRDQVERLPTASAPVDASALLEAVPTATTAPTATATSVPEAVVEEVAATIEPTATTEPSPTPVPTVPIQQAGAQARITGINHEFQGWNNCGPTTVAMALSYFDIEVTQDETAPVLKPSAEDRNVSPYELADYVNEQTNLLALDRTNGTLEELRQFIANGMPVIIEIGIDPPGEYAWLEWYGHYMLVVAYDDDQQTLYTYDSWFGTSEVPGENATPEGRLLDYETLNTYWRQFNRNYVVMYRPEQADIVQTIIGEDMDDTVMWQNSLAQVQNEINAEPDNGYLWFNLGTTYNALGQFDEAALAFDKARELGLPWRMLWYQFGPYEAYYETGRFEEVILLADVTMGDRPYFEESFYFKGLAQIALGNVEEGRQNIEASVAFNPNYEPAVQALDQLNSSSN